MEVLHQQALGPGNQPQLLQLLAELFVFRLELPHPGLGGPEHPRRLGEDRFGKGPPQGEHPRCRHPGADLLPQLRLYRKEHRQALCGGVRGQVVAELVGQGRGDQEQVPVPGEQQPPGLSAAGGPLRLGEAALPQQPLPLGQVLVPAQDQQGPSPLRTRRTHGGSPGAAAPAGTGSPGTGPGLCAGSGPKAPRRPAAGQGPAPPPGPRRRAAGQSTGRGWRPRRRRRARCARPPSGAGGCPGPCPPRTGCPEPQRCPAAGKIPPGGRRTPASPKSAGGSPPGSVGAGLPVLGGAHGDAEAVARLLQQGLGREGGPQAVAGRHHLHHRAEGDHVVGAGQGGAGGEVDAVLPRPADVLGVLGLDAHLLQGQADVPAHVLPLVLGGLVQKAGAVEGGVRGLPLLPGAEQVKVVLRPEVHPQPPLSDVAHRVPQNLPAVLGEGLPVLCLQVAVEPGHPAVAGPPGQQGDGVRVGEQEQLPVPGL